MRPRTQQGRNDIRANQTKPRAGGSLIHRRASGQGESCTQGARLHSRRRASPNVRRGLRLGGRRTSPGSLLRHSDGQAPATLKPRKTKVPRYFPGSTWNPKPNAGWLDGCLNLRGSTFTWNPKRDYWALNAGYRVADGSFKPAESDAPLPPYAQNRSISRFDSGLFAPTNPHLPRPFPPVLWGLGQRLSGDEAPLSSRVG